jgi:activator of 2-hydroxyglutaryl-CoA dehydratase
VLQVDLNDIGPLSLKSKRAVNFTTGCAVFTESEAISRISEGASKEDILAGVHASIAGKVSSLVRMVGLEGDCALIGGGAKDIGLIESVRKQLGRQLFVPEEPQITAALGAALIATEPHGANN